MSQIVQPSSAFDWEKLAFNLYPTNGYVKYTNRDGAWDKGEWVKKPYLQMHVGSVALNYGQSVFEGLKAFRAKDGSVRIFRPTANAARMRHSADIVSMPEIPESIFVEGCERAVAGNLEFVPPYAPNAGGGALYLRPLYFGSGENLILNPPSEFTFLVFVTPVGALYGGGKGVGSVDGQVMEDFDRSAPKGTGTAKLAGNYAPVFKHTAKAKAAGFGITLHLDSKTRTMIDEFSTSNALFIKTDGDTVTLVVPKSDSILRSITSSALMTIAEQSLGWKLEHRPVAFQELIDGKFSECAAAGTAAALTPVKSISHSGGKIAFGDGQSAGPNFTKLLQHLTGLQCGDIQDTFDFCYPKDGVAPA